jgi:hypothetical protein
VPYFVTEGSGLRIAAFTILPVEAVSLKRMVLVQEKIQREDQSGHCGLIGRI